MVQAVGLSFLADGFSGEAGLHLFEENAIDPDTDGPRARSQYILFPEALGRASLLVVLPLPIVSEDMKHRYREDWGVCV
jgi:hypothetical protein